MKPSLSAQKKVDAVIEYLTESHLFVYGGYPYDYEVHAGKLFVAALDDAKDRNRTRIDVYPMRQLEAWYNRALKYLKANKLATAWTYTTASSFGDWDEAFEETRRD